MGASAILETGATGEAGIPTDAKLSYHLTVFDGLTLRQSVHDLYFHSQRLCFLRLDEVTLSPRRKSTVGWRRPGATASYVSIAFIVLVQLNYAIAPRLWRRS